MLGFETIVAFLAGLVLYGLDALPGQVPSWWGIIAGVVLALLLLATIGVLGRTWGIALGWVWQALILVSAVLVPALAVIALIFGAMYAYATIKGGALDRRNARAAAAHTNGD